MRRHHQLLQRIATPQKVKKQCAINSIVLLTIEVFRVNDNEKLALLRFICMTQLALLQLDICEYGAHKIFCYCVTALANGTPFGLNGNVISYALNAVSTCERRQLTIFPDTNLNKVRKLYEVKN